MAKSLLSRRRVLAMMLAPLAAFMGKAIPAAVAAPASPAAQEIDRFTSASAYCTDSQEARFLTLINDYRAKNGLRKLSLSRTLGAAAEHHSKDMARYNYFSHTLRGGVSWSSNIRKHGYRASSTMAENIAAGHASADDTFRQWRNSASQNKNMLSSNFRAIGIGRASKSSSTYHWYWTTTFGGALDSGAGRC
jgi:uncharacterized protein YkwD